MVYCMVYYCIYRLLLLATACCTNSNPPAAVLKKLCSMIIQGGGYIGKLSMNLFYWPHLMLAAPLWLNTTGPPHYASISSSVPDNFAGE